MHEWILIKKIMYSKNPTKNYKSSKEVIISMYFLF